MCIIFDGNKGIKCLHLTVCNFVFIFVYIFVYFYFLFMYWSVRTDQQHRLKEKPEGLLFLIEVLNKGLESWKAEL